MSSTTTHTHSTLKLTRRLRRLRQSETMRALVRETRLAPEMFVLPLFVCEGEGVRREVPSMPGVYNLSVDETVREVDTARAAVSMFANVARSVARAGGFGMSRRMASVMMARVPSEPTRSCVRSYPTTFLTALDPV